MDGRDLANMAFNQLGLVNHVMSQVMSNTPTQPHQLITVARPTGQIEFIDPSTGEVHQHLYCDSE